MTYIDGFVIAVPAANRQAFIDHASKADQVFIEHGALSVRECWGDEVPRGKQTDFYDAVAATEDECVVFSWIEWPDKATRDAQMAVLDEVMKTDPRICPATNPAPFDAKRMIYGGFVSVVALGG